MKTIDLRSDTVTKPSLAMREAMLRAEVGDDVFGEDPTVNRLQSRVADLFGKESALFVPTGVMSNQLAIRSHTQPGDEIILDRESHIFLYETAAPAILSAVQLRTIEAERGVMTVAGITSAIRPDVYYHPRTSLICIENTHNKAGGTVVPLHAMQEIFNISRERNVRVHLDGARIWNAAVASGTSLREYAAWCDSLTVCFSKGLGAPVGSMLIGPADFIRRAHKFRKIFGGGMRQSGILAAACEYALDHNLARLADDHHNASLLVDELRRALDERAFELIAETNIVLVKLLAFNGSIDEIIRRCEGAGVRLVAMDATTLRLVTHLDVTTDDVREAASRIIPILQAIY